MKRIGALAAMIGFAVQRSSFLFIGTVVLSALLAASSASAADSTVVCPGGGPVGPGVYSSITAALNAITNNQGPNSISVSGTCTENIFIVKQSNLTIHNSPGSTAVITNAANPAQITVKLFGSSFVTFDGLSIQGGVVGIFVEQSDVQMFNSVIEKNIGDGAAAVNRASLTLGVSCIIRNNGGNGVVVGDLSIGRVTSPVQILNNHDSGAVAVSAGYITFATGGHIIDGNGFGISADGDGHVLLTSNNLLTVIRNSVFNGLSFIRGSTGRIEGQNTIENNGPVGIRVESSTVTVFGSTMITGHRFTGVDVSRGGELSFSGAHQITGNGNPVDGAGIRVERSSLNLQDGASVSNNVGPGIFGDAHAGIVLGPTASVTSNSSGGIRLKHQSLVGLTAPVTIQGNGSANIACDGTSLAYGQLVGITGVQCGD
jgi:hypothetical protein